MIKLIKRLLQGRPFGHPLHPIFTHFPIALLILSLVFDFTTFVVSDGNQLVRDAFYTMALGTVMGIVASIFGLADYTEIRADHPAKTNATVHMALNLTALALYAVNLNLRSGGGMDAARTPLLPFIMSLLGVGVISASGYLGGTLVYDDGIGVGRHLRRTDLPRTTLKVSSTGSAAAPDGFVPVANDADLPEGGALRVEVGHTVIAIAKLEGQTYAFQEFCTHRYGPLSEGSFHGQQVQCPWHRSCFDLRTGEVTQGPAKTPINVYESRVEEGKVLVKVGSNE